MNLRKTIWALVVALAICAVGAHAQDQKQDSQQVDPYAPIQPVNSGLGGGYAKPPAPAARGVSSLYDPEPYDPSQVTPDQNTLAGAEFFGLGSLEHTHNVFDPSISFSQLGQTESGTGGQDTLSSTSLIGGRFSFDRAWSRFHLTTIYNGGETFNEGGENLPNSQFHNLIFAQQIDWARWHVIIRDDFVASPGAAFTGTGMGGPGLAAQFSSMLGASLTSIGQEFIPSDSIETGNAMRYRNSILGQTEYSFSRRSAFTFAGSYGLLHFTDAGYISSHMLDAQAGYDYLLDPTNSVAILGSYGKIDYTGTAVSTTDYMAALAYGRKITGRVAFQVAAGPEQIRSMNAAGSFMRWFESVNSRLSYDRRRSGVFFSFARGLSSGSGVYQGSTSDTFSSTAHYQFTRFMTGTVTGGYALNNSLAPAGVPTTQFDNWFIGANLGRQFGPHAQLNLNYGLQRQNSPTSCPVANCGATGFQQTFGMTVNWHLRPPG